MKVKVYSIREFSPLWWISRILIVGAIVTVAGIMTSWDLGLL